MSALNALLFGFAVLALGAVVTALMGGWKKGCGWVAMAFTSLASASIAFAGASVFLGEEVKALFPGLGAFGLTFSIHLEVDKLSAVFLLLTALISFCASLFSVRYMSIYRLEGLRRFYPFLLLFYATVVGVVVTRDMLVFIVAWEMMTLTSFALVVFERGSVDSMRAGFRYFLTTHLASACIILAAIILYTRAASMDFSALRTALEGMLAREPALAHVVLALFFIGFATKAGILPFGFWLPDAYPAAPTAATAAFAGTMSKVAVYGILRVFVDILPISPFSTLWGQVIAVFGTLSIFIGTVTALVQHDSKRLLSFHMIGQVGYMLLGIGMGVTFLRISPALAVLGLVGGLFHLVNNACYKPLLFLNAGAGLYRSGTRDLNHVGGLATIMPLTAGTAVIASLAIAGVPPLSGFSSKWLIFQTSIGSGMEKPLFMALGIIAIFISAVTLASFLKFLGTLFLGKLHVEKPDFEPKEVPFSMRLPQVIIAIFCILLGVYPLLPVRLLYGAVGAILPANYAPSLTSLFGNLGAGLSLSVAGGTMGVWNPLVVLAGLVICLLISYGIYLLAHSPVRKTATWLCGEEHQDDEVRYKAHGFYLPFNEFLSFRVGRRQVATFFPSIPRPKVGNLAWLRKVVNLDEWLIYPAVKAGGRFCERFRESHVGIPQVYVLWMAVGMILAIIVLYALSS
jgi:hydrogenase-4 component B